MKTKRQKGFTLLELVVAMTVMAILATIGFKFIKNYTNQAKHLKATEIVRTVSQGIDQYYMKHGRYPELGSYAAMVDPNGPLAKENFIPNNYSDKDPWDQPYEGTCGKNGYVIKCAGDPKGEFGPFEAQPGREMKGQDAQKPAEQTK